MGETPEPPLIGDHEGSPTVGAVAHDRQLVNSPFPGDDGRAAESLRSRLRAALDGQTDTYLRAVAALGEARLLVPVVAAVTRSGSTESGLRLDKEADMSVVWWQTGDGRRCGVAFTGLDSLAAWHPEARPVPITLDLLAQAVLDDDASTVIVDPAGPATLVLEVDLVSAFASGRRLVELDDGGFGWMSVVS
jgi:hypothetical protein